MVDFTVKLKPVRPPNFVRIDGMESTALPISQLSEEQKDELAREWRLSLDEVAKRQRNEQQRR